MARKKLDLLTDMAWTKRRGDYYIWQDAGTDMVRQAGLWSQRGLGALKWPIWPNGFFFGMYLKSTSKRRNTIVLSFFLNTSLLLFLFFFRPVDTLLPPNIHSWRRENNSTTVTAGRCHFDYRTAVTVSISSQTQEQRSNSNAKRHWFTLQSSSFLF